jgi:hypothetical protein
MRSVKDECFKYLYWREQKSVILLKSIEWPNKYTA